MSPERSSDAAAAQRKLMREDTRGQELVPVWIWEYVLKFTSDARLIRELTASLPFPEDVPRLKQMTLLKELSRQVAKGLDLEETVDTLEALLHASTKQPVEKTGAESEDGAADGSAGERSKRLKASGGEAKKVLGKSMQEKASGKIGADSGEESMLKELEQPIFELKEEVQQLLAYSTAEDEAAQKGKIKEAEKRLRTLIGSAWAALGPVFLEKTEASVLKGLYKPQGTTSLHSPAVGQSTAGEAANDELNSGKRRDLDRARQALVDSCAELQKVVRDPLPGLLSKPVGSAEAALERNYRKEERHTTGPGTKRSLLDPYIWDDNNDAPDDSPSASRRIRLPPIAATKRTLPLPRSSPPKADPPPPPSVTIGDSNRRERKRWSDLEVETLKREVQKYGKGRWKTILRTNFDVFRGRTEVDIKDKWRNLEKYEGIRI